MPNNPANELLARRDRNLRYFRAHYPDVYMFFADYQMQRYRLNILPDTNEIDLLGPDGSVYNNGAKAFARQECQTFRSVFSKGKALHTVAPLTSDGLSHPRFMHSRLKRMAEPFQEEIRALQSYTLEFYPMLVCLGIGLGLHIEALIHEEKVQNLIVAESEPDFFAASLYAVDWETICGKFRVDQGRSIHFVVGMTGKEEDVFPDIWNTLIRHCPVYPAGTMFYTHRGNARYNQVANRINQEMHLFLASWGHYDDEIRQLNNALHTFRLDVPLLPDRLPAGLDVPVFIVGNGPSLDARIAQLKAHRGRAIVVSCGTALRSLLEYGVEPDCHVELESDFITFRVLDAMDHETLSRLRLIAPTHICPLIFTLFGDGRTYFKQENCIPQFFADGAHIIEKGVPTCVNAALTTFLHLGFKTVFLYGMDFGFRDPSYHHSRASIYMASDKGEVADVANFGSSGELEVEAWDGGIMRTTHVFFSTKRMIDRVAENLKRQNGEQQIFCCSDGARLENIQWLSDDEMRHYCEGLPETAPRDLLMDEIFTSEADHVRLDTVDRRISSAQALLNKACDRIRAFLSQMPSKSLWEFSCICSRINTYLEYEVARESEGLYYLIRGSIRHFTFLGLTYAWAIEEPLRRQVFMDTWRQVFTETLKELPEHFHRVTGKEFNLQQDPWVMQSINDPETFAPV